MFLKESKGDTCPAGRWWVAGFIVPDELPHLKKLAKKDLVIVNYELCRRCPDRGIIYMNRKEQCTVKCGFKRSHTDTDKVNHAACKR